MSSASIELDPPEMLQFKLSDPGVAPKAILKVVNKGTERIAFKVKTTKPRRYLVRPNQGLVEVGKSTDVTVILQQKDCEELIQSQASLTDSTDKFLVQSAVVADNFFDETSTKPAKEQTDSLSSMWSTADKKTFTNKKLKCEFVFPKGAPAVPAQAAPSGAAPPAAADSSMYSEVQKLRKKYDELVAFDAELMQERDKLSEQLKRKNQELEEAKSTSVTNKKTDATSSAAVDTKQSGSFVLVHLIIVAAVFFIFGRLF